MPIFDFECQNEKCAIVEEHVIVSSEHEKELMHCGQTMKKVITQGRHSGAYFIESLADRILREQGHRPDFNYANNRALQHLPKE